jgi:hypothetical protein
MTILCVYIFVVIGLPLVILDIIARVLEAIEGMNQ